MNKQVNLLSKLPHTKRCVRKRAESKTPEVIKTARNFGQMYFDGPRDYGYGGYSYDGRWLPVANDIINHFKLTPGQKVLEIGCAKGFLIRDLLSTCPGLTVFGIDISSYALENCIIEATGLLCQGNCEQLPFENNFFDVVLSINTIHNCDRDGVIKSLKEIQRVSNGKAFVQVDAYNNEQEYEIFMDWVLTAKFHGFPKDWIKIFKESGYTGDYDWTLV